MAHRNHDIITIIDLSVLAQNATTAYSKLATGEDKLATAEAKLAMDQAWARYYLRAHKQALNVSSLCLQVIWHLTLAFQRSVSGVLTKPTMR
jgi:Tfp pilus assembly protein PilE